MRRIFLAGVALLAATAFGTPTEETLNRVETWTFLMDEQRLTLQEAKAALNEEQWLIALHANEELIAASPKTIFDEEPTLPILAIRPAGSENLPAQKIVSGWAWRLECAHLALLALDWDGSLRRSRLVAEQSPGHAPLAKRMMARALARQGKYLDAIRFAPKQKPGVVDDEAVVWEIAQIDSPENRMKLSDIAVGSTLKGGLPSVGQNREQYPIGQRIEACLVLGDWWMRDAQPRMAASYYERAAVIAGRESNVGLLAGSLKKRAEG